MPLTPGMRTRQSVQQRDGGMGLPTKPLLHTPALLTESNSAPRRPVRVYVPTCSAFPLSALRDEARHLLCKSVARLRQNCCGWRRFECTVPGATA